MTRIFASTSPLVLPRRALTATALATLVLAGCGSEDASGSGSRSKPGGSVSIEESATSPGPEQAAFMAMLDKVALPCLGTETETGPGPSRRRPAGTAKERQESLAPGETPPAVPIEPGAPTGPETELNDRDWCMSVQHEQRIVEALQAVPEPTPARVRKVLNDLGYTDERIHGLRQDGKFTRFFLDLREKGGRLCEEGLAAGVETDISACVASAAGPFTIMGPEE
ncbi:hypothetical protein [Streptomyces sp. NPDC015242]|uniref:hypothetical protein n=1 Tax=Streptomyces sp. NPDC015242 TaxID=3364951 RepID=UPI0036F4C0D2